MNFPGFLNRSALLTVLAAGGASANWSITLDTPGGPSICPAIAEPITYNSADCQFVAQRIMGKSTRQMLWEDALVQAAVKSSGSSCATAYQHYLWLDGASYPLPAGTIVQHQRNALTAFALSLPGCQRLTGAAPVSASSPRLLLANTELSTAGSAYWFFDAPARRAYLRVSSFTGDVSCAGALPAPVIGDVVFFDGMESP